MEKILFLTHTEKDGALGRHAREALGTAMRLAGRLSGSELHLGLWGREVKPAADSVASCGAASVSAPADAAIRLLLPHSHRVRW